MKAVTIIFKVLILLFFGVVVSYGIYFKDQLAIVPSEEYVILMSFIIGLFLSIIMMGVIIYQEGKE